MKKQTNKIITLLVLAGIIFLGWYFFQTKTNTHTEKRVKESYTNKEENKHLSWEEFRKKAEEENSVVIDIRTADEYNAGKLFDDALTDFDYYHSDFEKKISELDPQKTYLIYCRSGHRSGNAIPLFEKYGLKAYDLQGGYNAVKK